MVLPSVPLDPEKAELLTPLVSALADLPAAQQQLVVAYAQGLADGYALCCVHATDTQTLCAPVVNP